MSWGARAALEKLAPELLVKEAKHREMSLPDLRGVTGVVRIHPEDIRPVPETIEQGSEYLRGIVRKNDRLYILLDREKALGA